MLGLLSKLLALAAIIFGAAWVAVFALVRLSAVQMTTEQLGIWLFVVPALAFTLLASGFLWWRHRRERRADAVAAAQQAEQENARQEAEDRARASDRRFDHVAIIQTEVLLSNDAYAADFAQALADAVPTVHPVEIEFNGEASTIAARRLPHSVPQGNFDCHHPRSRRIAAIIEVLLQGFVEKAPHALRVLAAGANTSVEPPDALTPFWHRNEPESPPSFGIWLLLDPSLAGDAVALGSRIESWWRGVGLPADPRVQIKLTDPAGVLAEVDIVIDAIRTNHRQVALLLAADAQIDDEIFNARMERSKAYSPAELQHRSHWVPSEGAAGLLLTSDQLAASLELRARAHLNRPAFAPADGAMSPALPEMSLLHDALVRGARDFDTPPAAARTFWLDADAPDAPMRRSIGRVNSLARPAAVTAFQPPKDAVSEIGDREDEPPEVLCARRVFGDLGAVNAVGLIAAAAQQPSSCDLVAIAEAGHLAAIAVTPPAPGVPA